MNNAKYYIDKLKAGYIIQIKDPKKVFTSAAFFTGFANKDIYCYSPAVGFCNRPELDFITLENHFENMIKDGLQLDCKSKDILIN